MTTPIEKAQRPAESELSRLGTDDKSRLSCQIRATGNGALEHSLLSADSPRQKWYQWFSPSDTPEERRLIMKLDGLIMVFVFLAYWAKVLDSSATSAAYVSGMKEDLRLFGNELNYLNTTYMVGYITFQIPLTVLMTRFSASYFIPGADLIWGILTLAQYKVTSVHQLYIIRFFVGASGSLFFPAVQWYLGCWYKRSELSRRGALFFIASQVGGMSSGYIQSGAYATLNGSHGIEGWRWLYIICFACTIPIAALGFLVLPSHPDKCKPRLLTEKEIQLARERMAAEHREPPKPLNLNVIRTVLSGWHFWILVSFAFFFSQADGVSSNSGLALWLKEENYSVQAINTITTVSPAVTIISSIICGILSDAYDAKVSVIAVTALLNIFASIVLAIWHVPTGLRFFAFFLAGSADGIAAVIYAWANEICAGNAEERAIVISSMNTIGNTFGAWLPLFVWKTVDAPRYLIGYNWTISLDVCMLGMLFVLRSFWNRERRSLRGT
ncbi:major facilitator superfamily domain-containing protein [Dactylonectria estremocensis]|uniref:Major facilitator superfamily domain-containing protein n=1 Tax=Dactylonectria estremocensis TaxID=1079267 RepID=A0A9P9FGS6_9HYPO|nr:major facilitator superfamily domain-containing protein [Dactylonectria estremocensis]